MFGAFVVIWWYRSALLKALAFSTVLLCLLGLWQFYLLKEWNLFFYLLVYLINSVLFVLFSVNCHRIILLGSASVPAYGLKSWSRREMIFFIRVVTLAFLLGAISMLFLMVLSAIIPNIISNPDRVENEISRWMTLLASIPGTYVIARLSLVLPATATDEMANLSWSWQKTAGNGWRMVIIIFGLPWLLSYLTNFFWQQDATIIEIILFSIVSYLMMAVEIAALSLCYKELNEKSVINE